MSVAGDRSSAREGSARVHLTERTLREPLRNALAERSAARAAAGSGTASAVLVPLFEGDTRAHGDDDGNDVRVWLVRRATGMRSHSGQVAFPGGKRDPDDASLLETALRETTEEIGIARAHVDVLGPLDDLVTGTGYVISPYVAWIARDAVLTPNPSEVARVFSAPFHRFLGEPGTVSELVGRMGYSIDGELVWGATSIIARRLGAIVRELLR